MISVDRKHIIHSITVGGSSHEGNSSYYDFILQYSPTDRAWLQIGQLQQSRSTHGVSLVNAADIMEHCKQRLHRPGKLCC